MYDTRIILKTTFHNYGYEAEGYDKKEFWELLYDWVFDDSVSSFNMTANTDFQTIPIHKIKLMLWEIDEDADMVVSIKCETDTEDEEDEEILWENKEFWEYIKNRVLPIFVEQANSEIGDIVVPIGSDVFIRNGKFCTELFSYKGDWSVHIEKETFKILPEIIEQ